MMKNTTVAAALALLMAATAVPAQAEQSELSVFLFGRDYNDGVMAVPVTENRERGDDLRLSNYAFPARMRIAQGLVMGDPYLQHALARRNIAVHNVLWVQTAANGGRIIYYR
ncbi:MAG TPA: hypothetical protein VHG11_03015 [Pseudorhizobium sp.]|nr:hypothetical protein [Pseudorhizobium sp.]